MNWLIRWFIRHEVKKMSDSTKKWLHNLISIGNIGVLIGQILSILPPSPKIMALQAVYQVFAPSLFGIGHTILFGGKQESAPTGQKP